MGHMGMWYPEGFFCSVNSKTASQDSVVSGLFAVFKLFSLMFDA